ILKRVQDDNKSEYLDRSVWTVGNIGLPALDVLDKIRPDDAVCYEMSSFQLWDLKKSPHIAVLTIIEPDHLNVHKDFAEYVAAKTNIVKFQTAGDFVIYNADDAEIRRMAAQSKGCKVAYSAKVMPDLIKQNLRLPGAHNQMDALAATLAATAFCRPELFKNNADAAEILKQVQADGELIAAIARALQNFHGLPHRLQFAGEKRGVKYFDDSFATAPGAAITALKAFPGAVKSIILGGSDKGADFTELAKAVSKAKMRKVYLIGQIGRKIGAAITKFAPDVNAEYLPEKNLAKIVQQIAGESQPGDVVILSPAAASFDMFKNYYDRGEQFLAAVKALPE
ncbi:MAG: UDP-N-acetylmuramoyl-L-alanine--D-glutamate ligase, partial [Candidatus Nomurabacteria bacterium]|nr:UDP-N-acetylmuramoyl-L-alanine--D-glutamate ligase [Candidatus Nomurabacteria bacterium]